MKNNLFKTKATYCFTLLFLTIIIVVSSCRSSKNSVESMYRKGKSVEFEKMLANLHSETLIGFDQISGNDTIENVNSLFSLIFSENLADTSAGYFFLQPSWPMIMVGNNEINFEGKFYARMLSGSFKPIQFDFDLVNQIIGFIGNKPDESDSDNSTSKNLDYERRIQFLNQFFFLPHIRGYFVSNLLPFRIIYIKFNSTFSEAEIKYSFNWSGATEIFQLENGNWTKVRTILKWLE